MNLAGCPTLTTHPENLVWYRAIQPQHYQSALGYNHTANLPSRYSPAKALAPAFPVLYFAENQQVAFFEVGALLGSPYPPGIFPPEPSPSMDTPRCSSDFTESRIPFGNRGTGKTKRVSARTHGRLARIPGTESLDLNNRTHGRGPNAAIRTGALQRPRPGRVPNHFRRPQRTGILLSFRRSCNVEAA